ncbi:MAG: hypothetical protein F4W90_10615 [Gammaproteobacteria bacterium]|nr:hypothetical protein [Gammaproteobacteria bacterium]
MNPAAYCIVTVTDQRALDSVHEAGSQRGSFRDRHPWLVALELLEKAQKAEEVMPLIFAVEPELQLKDWALVTDIDVATYSGQAYETRCSFEQLRPVNPIFESLDSLMLLPSQEQLHREALEPIRKYREHLDDIHVHPYAICETPAFVYADLHASLPHAMF